MKYFFLLFFCYLSADSNIYRDLEPPIVDTYKTSHIYIITPLRTGSTLIFNIFQYLFENRHWGLYNGKVTKSHSLHPNIDKQDIIITTIRDPLSIYASRKNTNERIRFFDPIQDHESVKQQCKIMLLFKYEDFENDQFDNIFSVIESKLDIQIDRIEKEYIQECFCVKSMKKIQQEYKDFSEFDNVTGIHGKHINHSNWREVLSKDEALQLYKKSYEIRKKWGYPDIDIDEVYNN